MSARIGTLPKAWRKEVRHFCPKHDSCTKYRISRNTVWILNAPRLLCLLTDNQNQPNGEYQDEKCNAIMYEPVKLDIS